MQRRISSESTAKEMPDAASTPVWPPIAVPLQLSNNNNNKHLRCGNRKGLLGRNSTSPTAKLRVFLAAWSRRSLHFRNGSNTISHQRPDSPIMSSTSTRTRNIPTRYGVHWPYLKLTLCPDTKEHIYWTLSTYTLTKEHIYCRTLNFCLFCLSSRVCKGNEKPRLLYNNTTVDYQSRFSPVIHSVTVWTPSPTAMAYIVALQGMASLPTCSNTQPPGLSVEARLCKDAHMH